MYISFLVQKNVSVSVLNSNFFSISWKHDFSLVKNPCKENFVVFTIEGARRILSRPVKKKKPVTIEVMKMLYTQFGNSQELAKIRIYCMFSLAFSGFLRFDELVNIRFKDIRFCPSHAELFIPRSKTDIFREGNKLYIARTNKNICPVACLEN